MNRISVVGTSGSGKTTFAGKLSKILRIPHVELDVLSWEAGWTPSPKEIFRSRVREAVGGACWVVDGNYGSDAQDLVWERADTVVWLNYSYPVTIYRVVIRTLRRVVTREECCNGNQESLRLVLSPDSIIWWAMRTYHRHRAEYPARLATMERRGAHIIKLRSPKEAERWLARLTLQKL
jgi:adenylate kinase family enzyme